MGDSSEPGRKTDPELAEVLAELMNREPIFHRAKLVRRVLTLRG
jgi:hypothetical protein